MAPTGLSREHSTITLFNVIAIVWVLALYWQLSAKKGFVGPSKTGEAALRKLEAAFAPGAVG
jgi:hypothetical protein